MTLDALMHIADDAYPDGLVWEYYTDPTASGDTLAQFIMIEIRDTFDATSTDVRQLEQAVCVMDRASREMDRVTEALHTEISQHCVIIAKET